MTPEQAKPVRTLVLALMFAPVIIAAALFATLVTDDAGSALTPPLLAVAVQVAAAIVIHFICEALYRQIQPLTLADANSPTAVPTRFQSNLLLRFAVCEVLLLGSIAAAFVVTEGGLGIYLVGAVLTELLFFVHAYPWRRPLLKSQERLESQGVRSGLTNAFGVSV